MFFDEEDLVLKRKATLKAPPSIPETNWKPPTEFPNLSAASVIAVDTETKEFDFSFGPGWGRHKGHIVGYSLAARDRIGNTGKWYFPFRHEVSPEDNLDPARCLEFARHALSNPSQPKVGAHLIYDIGWLAEEGVYVEGPLYDVQFAEALLDEDAKVALDVLGWKYCRERKQKDLLRDWIVEAYKPKETEWRGEIWRAPPRLVGPYGEQDADLPLRVLTAQWPLLNQQGLMTVFEMECKLIRLLVRMRLSGVRVDVDYAQQLDNQLTIDIQNLYKQLHAETGLHINAQSPGDVARLFDQYGIQYPRTLYGAPSFRKDFMKNLDHPIATLINDIREHIKIQSTFIRGYILDKNVNGRVFCQFHPLRGEESGTTVGRFSSSDPNLQNIPVRTTLGKRVRHLFIPDIGHVCWEKDDYSQLQYRGLAHYATDRGDGSAERLRQDYRDNPETDYHARIQAKFEEHTGKKLERRPIKNLNFGLVFGLGTKKLIRSTGIVGKAGQEFYNLYHEIVPYAKPTMEALAKEVQTYGYITSPLGRRCRFNLWEPIEKDYDNPAMPLPYQEALYAFGPNIKRAKDYTGIAYKLQSFEADVIKSALVKIYEAGIFEMIGLPKLLVHDEFDFSVIDDSPAMTEAYAEMRRIMENAIPLSIPLKVDFAREANWGKCKD
jgi:DNA polymerase-1